MKKNPSSSPPRSQRSSSSPHWQRSACCRPSPVRSPAWRSPAVRTAHALREGRTGRHCSRLWRASREARSLHALSRLSSTVGRMPDRLRPLWDFDDLDGTSSRFREQLDAEEFDSGRAEVLSQLARVEGMRDDFDACDELLTRPSRSRARSRRQRPDRARARPKVPFQRRPGRGACLSSSRPSPARARRRVLPRGRRGAHVRDLRRATGTRRSNGRNVVSTSASVEPDAAYWAGPLLNNLGWAYFDAGDHERALELFERRSRSLRSGERRSRRRTRGCNASREGGRSRNRATGARRASRDVVSNRSSPSSGSVSHGGDGTDEDVRARSRVELVVERARPHAARLRIGPAAAEEIRAALRAERLRASSGGSKVCSRSSPSRIRIEVEGTRPFTVPVPPESFLQLSQWQ